MKCCSATIICAIVAVLGHGCAANDTNYTQPERSQQPVTVSVQPSDLTSSVRGSPITISLWRNGVAIPDDLVSATADSVRVLYGTDESIPFELTVLPKPPVGTFYNERRDIQVKLSQWPSEWFEVRFRTFAADHPYNTSVGDEDSLQAVDADEFRARLHPDDAPVGRFVQVCQSEGAETKAFIQFSQNVLLLSDRPTLDFGGERCERNMGDAVDPGDGSVPSSPTVSFKCGKPSSGSIRVELRGLSTPSGAYATLLATHPSEQVFEAESSDAWEPEVGCLRWSL